MAWSGDSSHVDFSHNVLHGVRYGPNIHFNHGKDCKFDDNLFVGDTTNDATTDPQLYGGIIEITDPSGEAIISNNMFRNYFANGAVKINSTGTNGKVIVSNNQFINPRSIGNGAFATAIFTSGVDASIIGNQAIGFVAGMGGIFVQNATRFIISENILDANATVAGATGIKIKDSKYGSVMGNIIKSSWQGIFTEGTQPTN
jgi:nitrous oxidase accessory protein NosD